MRYMSIAGIAVAVASLVVAVSIGRGVEKSYIDALLGFNSHIIITGMPEISDRSYVESQLKTLDDGNIVNVAPFIYREALIVAEGQIKGIAIKGVEPDYIDLNGGISYNLFSNYDAVDLEDDERLNIILGAALYDKLLKAEDVKLMIPRGDQNLFLDADVIGTFESGIHDFDGQIAIISLKKLGTIFEMKDGVVSGLEVRLNSPFLAQGLAEKIDATLGAGFGTTTWKELNSELLTAVKLEKMVTATILAILVIVAALNIIAVIVLIMLRRIQELAIFKALGLQERIIKRLFIRGGVVLDLIGVTIGLSVGIVISLVAGNFDLVPIEPEIYLIDSLPVDISPMVCGLIAVFCISVGYFTSLLAARRIVKSDLLQSLGGSR